MKLAILLVHEDCRKINESKATFVLLTLHSIVIYTFANEIK